ncbi:uncharacterized protein LOC133749999 isoform X2 [Lepus europaeus]|uniref:uncharacterized protein LOC133749999 isoform X2 n=1 Tax=Lepus europaeus TaxID=9983 RepID=UPI002B46E52F|nr:uncharacterized protein LOC133749999 isoform X2 [Lepus europaeus]
MEEMDQSFNKIKTALLSAPALGLPDVIKLFYLYIGKQKRFAKGVLTQYLGPWRRLVAYLSKRLDPVATRWPSCLRIIAATALIVKDANKLTMGQELYITTPHAIEGVLKEPPDRWLSNARLTHYQGLLLNPLKITFQAPSACNPATLLLDPDLEAPLYDSTGILAQAHGIREDLRDQPLSNAELVWFTYGNRFIQDSQRSRAKPTINLT